MRIADLYIRVSTDEQADKVYSQPDQEERLKKYCEINSIQVRNVIFEDHSAKTFKRPQWAKLLIDYVSIEDNLILSFLLNGTGLVAMPVTLIK